MKTQLTICIFVCLLFSCRKSNEEILNPCIGKVETEAFYNSCKQKNLDQFFCEIQYSGEYKIKEFSKAFMPQYCQELGTIFSFRNNQNELLDLELIDKKFTKISPTSSYSTCTDNSGRTLGDCINTERISIVLKSLSNNLELIINISPRFAEDEKIVDILSILRKATPTTYNNNFLVVINSRDSDINKFSTQEHFDSIKIVSRTFTDVLSSEDSFGVSPKYKYYYNMKLGLIGMVDTDGRKWELIE